VREENPPPLDWRGFLLTGFGFAGIVYGFQNLGRGALPFTVVAALLAGGAICLALYPRHARRTPHAILDLSLLRLPTFVASTIGGAFVRIAVGGTPFLLAMLLQMGLGLSAFTAGLMTFASGAGALAMKTTARPILERFGFRSVLVVNTIAAAAMVASYSLFGAHTPHWLIFLTLLTGGFFNSLQFTALNAIGYADIEHHRMSRASSLASMAQQLAQSVGIGFAAILIGVVRGIRHSPAMTTADVSPVFVILALVSLPALGFFARLTPEAGAELSGGQRPVASPTAALEETAP